jgi:hypothetical protein
MFKNSKSVVGLSVLLAVALLVIGGCSKAGEETSALLDDLVPLSDEFNSDSLSKWTLFNPEEDWANQRIGTLDIHSTKPDHLIISPVSGSWFDKFQGLHLYKEVEGNFVVTSKLLVSGKKTDTPEGMYELGGLLVRQSADPADQQLNENWVYVAHGTDNRGNMVFDEKSNRMGRANYTLSNSKTGWVELRIARIGEHFILMSKEGEADWTILNIHNRPDLADTLQVGLHTLTDFMRAATSSPADFNDQQVPAEAQSDLTVAVDYIHFNRPDIPQTLIDKINNKGMTDEDWLTFLKD